MDVITVGLATKALVVGVERNDMRVHACKPVLLNVIGLRLGVAICGRVRHTY